MARATPDMRSCLPSTVADPFHRGGVAAGCHDGTHTAGAVPVGGPGRAGRAGRLRGGDDHLGADTAHGGRPGRYHGRLFGLLRTLMQATPPLGAGMAALTLRHGNAVTVLAVCALMAVPALAFARDLTAADTRPAWPEPVTTASRA